MPYAKIIDISWPISPAMTAYKDRTIVTVTKTKNFETDGVREAVMTIGTHSGTHVDAPAHFMANGHTIDQQPLAALVGACRVLDLTHCVERVTATDLSVHNLQPGERILCKTRNSNQNAAAAFKPDFVFIDQGASSYLAACRVSTVGIDYLGIERQQPGHETHTTFFSAGITIVEGLRLAHVAPGQYNLICLPLLMDGLDAAPARAILLQD